MFKEFRVRTQVSSVFNDSISVRKLDLIYNAVHSVKTSSPKQWKKESAGMLATMISFELVKHEALSIEDVKLSHVAAIILALENEKKRDKIRGEIVNNITSIFIDE